MILLIISMKMVNDSDLNEIPRQCLQILTTFENLWSFSCSFVSFVLSIAN